jgi:hypothetical protein
MKKSIACALALAGVGLGLAAPMRAATVYVPVVDPVNAAGAPLATQLWISNFGNVDRPYATAFLQAERTEAAPKALGAVVPADRALYLDKVAAEGETGLLAIDTTNDVLVNAWVKSGHGQQTFYAGLPVITEENRLAAGATTYLNGVGRNGSVDLSQLSLVNLGTATALCQVDVVDAAGAFVRSAGSVEVPALSLARYEDGLGLRGEAAASAKISCDQPFYALAAQVDGRTSEVSFVNPATTVEKAAKPPKPTAGAAVTFFQPGIFHLATKANPKKILRVPVPAAMNAKMVTADLDVIVGPWNPRKKSGTHNMLWFHRGRFRSNTLGNLNAFGPGANSVKAQQNVDMAAHSFTQFKGGLPLTLGHTYHITHIYDAASKIVTFIMSENGHVLKQGKFTATAQGKVVAVASTGLVAEFGNYDWQALPEVGSIGWSFANFRVVIQP